MAGIRVKFHPLFFLFGIFYALKGDIFIFLIYVLSALLHEMGHSFMAGKLGYRLKEVVLYPFGAVVGGNVEGLKRKDEILVAIAGPILSLSVALFFVALWWIFPDLYAFTDVVVSVNLSVGLVNLLPCYPLDGGRILLALLKIKLGEKKGILIAKILGVILSLLLVALFVYSIFVKLNISLLFFALFILFGTFSKNRDSVYIKLAVIKSKERLVSGMEIRHVAVSENIDLKGVLSIIDNDKINVVHLLDDNYNEVATINQAELYRIMAENSVYTILKTTIQK